VAIAGEVGDDKSLFEFGHDKCRKGGIGAIEFPHHKVEQTTLSGRQFRKGADAGGHP
jgi:hypothetical protein